jgi:hypothetical protein
VSGPRAAARLKSRLTPPRNDAGIFESRLSDLEDRRLVPLPRLIDGLPCWGARKPLRAHIRLYRIVISLGPVMK